MKPFDKLISLIESKTDEEIIADVSSYPVIKMIVTMPCGNTASQCSAPSDLCQNDDCPRSANGRS